MSAASLTSLDSACGLNESLATIATRTDPVLGVRIIRIQPPMTASANTPTARIAGSFQSMFHRRRYQATASPVGNSDMMNITPHMPSHDAVCSNGTKSTCEYAGLPQD